MYELFKTERIINIDYFEDNEIEIDEWNDDKEKYVITHPTNMGNWIWNCGHIDTTEYTKDLNYLNEHCEFYTYDVYAIVICDDNNGNSPYCFAFNDKESLKRRFNID